MIFFDTIRDTLQVTSFVLITMLIIEYFAVRKKENWINRLRNLQFSQVLFASVLGWLPGCFGAFTAVSLFTHGVFGFPGLVTAMIASTGDEAFVMLAMIPEQAWKIFLIVLLTGLISGFILSLIFKKRKVSFTTYEHLTIHHDEPEYKKGSILSNFRTPSFQRVLLMIAGGGFLIMSFYSSFFTEALFEKIIYACVTLTGMYIIAIVPEHFLMEHIWDHIFKKHLLRIFLWTFGALFFIQTGMSYFHLEDWVKTNQLIILLIAVAVGIIPESGPHIVFISLFAKGAIPLSVLVANSIVQDGHGALPLLAESKKGFLALKLTNIIISLMVGLTGYFTGW